jgi:hypothetical protein
METLMVGPWGLYGRPLYVNIYMYIYIYVSIACCFFFARRAQVQKRASQKRWHHEAFRGYPRLSSCQIHCAALGPLLVALRAVPEASSPWASLRGRSVYIYIYMEAHRWAMGLSSGFPYGPTIGGLLGPYRAHRKRPQCFPRTCFGPEYIYIYIYIYVYIYIYIYM